MPSLLVTVFALEVVIQIINSVGAAAINNLLWTLFTSFPTQLSKDTAAQRQLQAEYLKIQRDLKATSSQDEFARWAKLRRQHDKLLEQLETKKAALASSRNKFDGTLTGVRLVATRAPQYVIPFWYAKEPMFWLPHGWFPWYAEWFLSLPRAPLGSVSIASWQVACTVVITFAAGTIAAAASLVRPRRAAAPGATAEKQTAAAAATDAAGKKEL